jgi:hypothetical protein
MVRVILLLGRIIRIIKGPGAGGGNEEYDKEQGKTGGSRF